MRLSYNKLWKLLIDKGLNKHKLQLMTGISPNCVAKLGKGDNLRIISKGKGAFCDCKG